jgi:peroxiredoxin
LEMISVNDTKGTPPLAPPLPSGLPVPIDDGQADHLLGLVLPELTLESSGREELSLAELASGRLVLFVFPSIGRPGVAPAPGWDEIPGARGCTQETCAYRDLRGEFEQRGYRVAGLSAQDPEALAEAAARLALGYPLLADPDRSLGRALGLPTFTVSGLTLYKRLTLVVVARRVIATFYPVYPPQENAAEVLAFIDSRATAPRIEP